jgi:hypothetical protein
MFRIRVRESELANGRGIAPMNQRTQQLATPTPLLPSPTCMFRPGEELVDTSGMTGRGRP